MPHRTPLLLLPLLAACASTAPVSQSAAPEENYVRVEQVRNTDVVLNADQAGYAYLLEVQPNREQVVRLVHEGEPVAISPGRQQVSTLDGGQGATRTANRRVNPNDRRYCGEGESLSIGAPSSGALGSTQSNSRPVLVRGQRGYRTRQITGTSPAAALGRQGLVLLVVRAPIAPQVLRDAVARSNARLTDASFASQGVPARVVDALREAGVHAQAVRVP